MTKNAKLCTLHNKTGQIILTHSEILTILTLNATDFNSSFDGERSKNKIMSGKHTKKMSSVILTKMSVALVLVLALSISSIATVLAHSVTANVIDGESTYTFEMDSADIEDIIAKAEDMGMEPIGSLDVYERAGNTTTVNVRRGVRFTVEETGQEDELIAYKGDTVEKSLLQNNIILKEKDEVTPERDAVITEDMKVSIRRFCTVTVTADNQSQLVSLTGGTVAQALEQVGVTVGPDDSVNYNVTEALFDNMNIKVTRIMTIVITADGESKEYKFSAATVKEALEKAGIEVSEDDKLNAKKTAKVKDGMEIVVQRVRKEETVKLEEIPFETVYEYDDDMYEDESYTKTEGEPGEKEVKSAELYVDNVLEKTEVISEKIKKKPVDRVIVEGKKKHSQGSGSSGSSSGNGSSFVDASGNTISYSSVLTGSGTAYCDSGKTATGAECGYGLVAVNPYVIPYGTRLYICSADGSYTYGYAIASDTGGALMAGDALVDIWLPTEDECYSFGRRTMNVYILN